MTDRVATPTRARPHRYRVAGAALVVGVAAVVVAIVLSLLVGSVFIAPDALWHALAHSTGTTDDVIVREMRIPRTVAAIVIGGALGVAGATMQALTRNPLAEPGLLGVNAGAGLAVVVAVGVVGIGTFSNYVWFALLGAIVAAVVVMAIGVKAQRSPLVLVLAGVAITAALTGVMNALALVDPERFNAMRGWMAGSLSGRPLEDTLQALIPLGAGALLAVLMIRSLSQLSLGDDLARALGVRTGRTRTGSVVSVALLAGASTAIAGPIAFVGLMVPHVARRFAGMSLAWTFVLSAVGGALLLLVADVIGRLVLWPSEAPAGLMTAIIGAPILIAFARKAVA